MFVLPCFVLRVGGCEWGPAIIAVQEHGLAHSLCGFRGNLLRRGHAPGASSCGAISFASAAGRAHQGLRFLREG